MSKMDIHGSLAGGHEANPKVCRCIPLEEVDNAVLLDGLKLWHALRGGRRFPSRTDVTPRCIKTLLRNTLLLRVIDGGNDYEYRIIGDAYVLAHGQSIQGKRLSQTATITPAFVRFIKPVYDRIVHEGEPVALRGWIERGSPSTGHVYCEYVLLPLGGETVDHIMCFAVYLRHDGLEHVVAVPSSFTI